MSSSNCCFLTCIQISQEAGQVVWYSHLFQNFPQFVVIHTIKGFGIVNKAEIDVFLELSCFSIDPSDVGNLISGSSAFSKTSLNIWKFMVHVVLKPGLENFEHYFTSVWDECNCVVVKAFFGFAFLWDICGCLCVCLSSLLWIAPSLFSWLDTKVLFHTCVPNSPLCEVFTDALLLRSVFVNSVHKMSMIIFTSQERIFTHLGRYWPWKNACSRIRGPKFVIILQLSLWTFLIVNENHSNTDPSRLLWGWNGTVHRKYPWHSGPGDVVNASVCYRHTQNTMCGAWGYQDEM